jgi:hypothetical protein
MAGPPPPYGPSHSAMPMTDIVFEDSDPDRNVICLGEHIVSG